MRQVLAEVARRLGFADFKVSALREEPVLASLAYAHLENVEHGGIILVYDLGGGSFDTAVVQMHRPVRGPLQLTVLAADGEPFCGGVDIDEAFFEHMTTLLAQQNFQPRHRGTAVLKPLSPRQEQAIRNRAQIAKESLSTQNEALVVFPPRTLDASAIELRVSRQNLEATIQETKLLDKTLECVLRAWRRARMLLRLPGESIGDYYLRRDPTSGILAGSVLKLGHADLRANVQRVLLVGGTTRTPFFRQHISALWGADKLIPESVVQPMEAAAVGAAWQDEDVSTIVDRLPFSIALRWNGGNAEQYRAFAPTVQYRTLTANPQVYPYRGRPADIPPNCDHATVELRDPGGHILEQSSIRGTLLSGCFIEIDSYGTIGLNRAHERLAQIPNPVQHQLQRDAWERLEAERKGAAAARAERERKLLRRNVFLEND